MFLIIDICFWYIFSVKEFTSSKPGVFRFLAELEKIVSQINAYLASCVKVLSPSRNVILSEDFA